MDINAHIPELVISVDENIYILRRVRRSLQYISLGVDAPQCICKALQKRFIFPRTVIDLNAACHADVHDENARRLRIKQIQWLKKSLLGTMREDQSAYWSLISHRGCIIIRFTILVLGRHRGSKGDKL